MVRVAAGDLAVPVSSRLHQRRLVVVVTNIQVGVARYQESHHVVTAGSGGVMEHGGAEAVRVDVIDIKLELGLVEGARFVYVCHRHGSSSQDLASAYQQASV